MSQVSTLEAAIQEIAKTVSADHDTSARVRAFLSKLGGQATEFKMITEDNSYQQIVNSIITADLSLFRAHSGSTNVLIGTTVYSDSTTLLATKGSKNFVDNTRFWVGGTTTIFGAMWASQKRCWKLLKLWINCGYCKTKIVFPQVFHMFSKFYIQ